MSSQSVSQSGKFTLSQAHIADLQAEIAEEYGRHPEGFTNDRGGVRYALATIQDELDETLMAWNLEKRSPGWDEVRAELLQVIGNGVRLLQAIDAFEIHPHHQALIERRA